MLSIYVYLFYVKINMKFLQNIMMNEEKSWWNNMNDKNMNIMQENSLFVLKMSRTNELIRLL